MENGLTPIKPRAGLPQLKGYWLAIDMRVGDIWKMRWLTYNITVVPPVAAASTQ